jgi:hypothetical protein
VWTDGRALFLVVSLALGIALLADVVVGRISSRGYVLTLVGLVLAAAVFGTIQWATEAPGYHHTNPDLSRMVDWFAHFALPGLFYAIPILVGLVLAPTLPREKIARPFRVLICGSAVFVSGVLSIIGALALAVVVYRDGP